MRIQVDQEFRAEKSAGAVANGGLAEQTLKDLKNNV
jgi:hypothetical protein